MMDINARVSGIKQHCLIGSELPQSLLELDRIHCNRSIPPRHYTRIACGLSSSTSSTNQADNIRPAMIVHEREENIRIKISHPHARVMSPNHGFRGDIRQMYCQAGGGPLHYQAMMRSCEVAELGALYLIMRQPNIDLQQLSALFSCITVLLGQPVGGLSNQQKSGPRQGCLLCKAVERQPLLQCMSPAYLEPLELSAMVNAELTSGARLAMPASATQVLIFPLPTNGSAVCCWESDLHKVILVARFLISCTSPEFSYGGYVYFLQSLFVSLIPVIGASCQVQVFLLAGNVTRHSSSWCFSQYPCGWCLLVMLASIHIRTFPQAGITTAVTTSIVPACACAGGRRRPFRHVVSFLIFWMVVLMLLFSRCGGQACSSGSPRNIGQEFEPLEYEKGEPALVPCIYFSHCCRWSWDGREYKFWGGNRHRELVSDSWSEQLRLVFGSELLRLIIILLVVSLLSMLLVMMLTGWSHIWTGHILICTPKDSHSNRRMYKWSLWCHRKYPEIGQPAASSEDRWFVVAIVHHVEHCHVTVHWASVGRPSQVLNPGKQVIASQTLSVGDYGDVIFHVCICKFLVYFQIVAGLCYIIMPVVIIRYNSSDTCIDRIHHNMLDKFAHGAIQWKNSEASPEEPTTIQANDKDSVVAGITIVYQEVCNQSFGSEMSDADEQPTTELNTIPLTTPCRRCDPSIHAGRRGPSTTGSRRGVLPLTSSGRRGWWPASRGELPVDSHASEECVFDRWWTIVQFQTKTSFEDRLTVFKCTMMKVRIALQAGCMTAWRTQHMDSLKAEGPLALRDARTSERQPTEPTGATWFIGSTPQPDRCAPWLITGSIPQSDPGATWITEFIPHSDPEATWLIADSIPHDGNIAGSVRLLLEFPVQTISEFLMLGFIGFRYRIRPEACHHARKPIYHKQIQHWWPHRVWLVDTDPILLAQMVPVHNGAGVLVQMISALLSPGHSKLQGLGGGNRTEAALSTRPTNSQGSLYGSVKSETDGGQVETVQLFGRPVKHLSIGERSARGSSGERRREGPTSSTAPQLQLPDQITALQADFLGLESDALAKWWDASTPQGAGHQILEPTSSGPAVMQALCGTIQQLSAGGIARIRAPPGRELTTASAVGNLGGERPEGLTQATDDVPQLEPEQGGDAGLHPDLNWEKSQPGVRTASLMNKPAVVHDFAQRIVLEQKRSDIHSFLSGTRPGILWNLDRCKSWPRGDKINASQRDTSLVCTTSLPSPVTCRGATLTNEKQLLSAAESDLLPLQTRTSLPSASVAPLSTAELINELPGLYLQDKVGANNLGRFDGLDFKVEQQPSKSHITLWEQYSSLGSVSVRARQQSLVNRWIAEVDPWIEEAPVYIQVSGNRGSALLTEWSRHARDTTSVPICGYGLMKNNFKIEKLLIRRGTHMPELQSSKSIPLEIKIVHTRLDQRRAAFLMENTSQEGRRSKPSDTDVEYNHDSHLQLRGQDPIGSCTATEAKYLMQLCDSIPGNIIKRKDASQDGRRIKPSVRVRFSMPQNSSDAMPQNSSPQNNSDELTGHISVTNHRLQELRSAATQLGWTGLLQTLVNHRIAEANPWIKDAPTYRASVTRQCTSKQTSSTNRRLQRHLLTRYY